MAGIFENIFTHEDENAGLKAIGHQNMQDEEVKQFNLQQKNEYQKIREQNKKDVFNFEDDETVKSKGKYTLMEVYDNHQKYKLVPYAGSGIEAYNDFKIFSHLNTLKKGGILTPEQVQETRDYIKTMREQELRGYTLPARVEQTILESSPYLVEAGIGFATAEYGVGLGAIGDSVLKFGARQSARGFAKKEIRNQLKKQINKDLTKRLIKDSTLGTARFTIEKTPTQFLKKAGEMMIADDIAVTERGQYILNEAETNPATTFMKALGDTMIENFSETSGVLFGGVAKNVARTGLVRGVSDFIHRNILENLPKGFTNGFKNLVEKTTKMSFGKALRQFGYHGILEEIGEERIGDFLRFAFDLDSEKDYSGRQLWSALFPDKEQLMTEAIAFGLTGSAIAGGLHGIKRGVQHHEYKSYAKNVLNASKNEDGSVNYELLKENIKKDNPTITDEKLNNIINAVTEGFNKGDKYTIDDFMVDTGIVRTPYKHSISNERIAEHLKETGMKDEDIQTILDFATDEDKAMLMSSRTPVKMTKEQQKEHAKIKEDLYNKLVNIGTDFKEADNISIVTGAMYERFGTKDEKSRKVFNDYMNNLVIRYNIPANQGKKYHQFIGQQGAKNLDETIISDLEKAKELDNKGTHNETIRKETGWFKGADNKWRYEISDKDAEVLKENIQFNSYDNKYSDANYYKKIKEYNDDLNKYVVQKNNGDLTQEEFDELYNFVIYEKEEYIQEFNRVAELKRRNTVRLGDILKHDKLFKAYPELKDVFVEFVPDNGEYAGAFYHDSNIIRLPKSTINSEDLKSVLMHEIQHFIQYEEEFARGGSPDSVVDMINRVIQKTSDAKRRIMLNELEELQRERFIIGSALQVLRMQHKPEAMFKTWWWSKYGSWYIPRKTRKKEYRAFINEWTDKFLSGTMREMEDKGMGAVLKYQNILQGGIEEATKKYRSIDAKCNRKWKQLPKDILRNFRGAIKELESNKLGFEERELKTKFYKKLAGETEARNTASRMNMSDEERKEKSPKFTQEYEDYEQLVVFSDGTTVSYSPAISNNEPKAYFQSAYHGSPHKFDEFSTDNIGTGEGAQAHGWGLYFASDKDVSEDYRSKLSGDKVYYNGQEIKKAYYYTHLIDQEKEKELNRYLQDLRIVIDGINKIKTTENISMNEAKQKFIENYESKTKLLAFQKKLLEIAKNIDTTKIEIQKGQLFEVDIPETDVLLDENKPLNEQPDKVKKAILEYYKSRPNDYIIPKDINSLSQQRGKEFYRDVAFQLERENSLAYRMANGLNTDIDENFNPEKEASLLLNSLGIKGITYDGKQDGRCYVVFDDKAIKVLKTYYQDSENGEGYRGYFQPDVEEEKLIAGFTYPEVLDKLTELYESIGEKEAKVSQAEIDKIMAKVHILEDAFQVAEGSDKFKNEDKNMEIMLNAYYIMNNQEIPQDYIDADAKSQRTYRDYKEMHDKKKEELESNLYDYYRTDKKHVVTIMANKDSSTALHEFGHVYLDLLEELAKVNDDAKQQLESVQKWLGYSGEWTTAQHEKFAGSFVAYLYKGKAPSNKLRTVFENFKEWLKSVYHSVLDIPDAEISDEVQELFDNIFGEDSYYQEKKEATALLRKVRKQSKKERLNQVEIRADRTLTDVEKRCKEVSYDILSVATGKDKKYLMRIFETDSTKNSYGRRREVVEELLDSVDDKITASGGMRGEWTEFYGDTGVSYENDEIDGDYNLASQALWTILNKDYFDPETRINNRLDEEADYFARAVDKADREYKILLSNYKRGNRNVVLSAVYEWIDSLDSQIKQDYEDRFIFDSGIIDRNENADKFDKAKRQILKRAMELESQTSINKNEKYQEIVKEIIKGLNFLQPSDKAKLTSNILDVPSTSFLMASIDNIMDIAKTMEDVNLRRNLEREIHKELQQTKNVKKNGRTVGKYNYKTNKLFEELRNLDRLSPEKANEMRLENKRFAEREDSGMSYADKLINKFLSYKAGGRTFANTELMKELYDEITRIKLAGKSAKDELDHMEKLTEAKDIEELISIVQNKKEANPVLKLYINAIANLESTINAMFNNDIKEKYASEILYAETQSQAWQHEQKKNFESAVAKIYNLPVWNWDFKILQYLNEKHTFAEIRRKYDTQDNLVKSRLIDRTLTKMDIIQAYIWSKNEILDKRLKNQFGEETLESMFELLTKEDEQLAEVMMRTAQSFYPLVNKAFIQKYGLDLPKVSCYFPSTPERGSEVDLYNDYSSKSLGNGFTKSRANSETQAMDFHNPIATLYSHIEGVSKFVFMSSALDTANLRFKDKDLKRVIVNKYGDDAYRTLEQALMNVTYKKEAPVFNGMNKILDNLIGNWIQANVSVKPIVGLKQLLSANNYAVDMPYMKWQVGFLKALSNPKGTIDYMMSIPYIKARYEGSFSNEFLKQTVENSAFAMSKKLKDCCNLFIKMGDIGAIIFGGKPYIDYLIKDKGMSESEAIKQFILSTNRSQQSSAVSSLSNFQVNMSRSSYGKLMIAFKNSPQQYARMCGDAIISACNGDITKGKMAKMLFQYAYLQPFLYTIATSGSLLRWIFAGDDDDFLHDMKMSIFNLNMNALPLVGDIYQHVVNVIETKKGGMTQTTPLLGDIEKEINKLAKEDSTLADWLESLGYIGLHVGAGYNTKAFTTMSSGVGDIATGETVQGAMKVLGYTDKRSKHIAGNEKKK